jgi:HemY protein
VAAWLAGLHLDAGRARAALRVVEQAWSRAPRPELAALHPRARGATDPIARVKAAERLAALAPRHPQSHLALARAAIDAQLWGEARRHLDAAGAVSAGQADGAVARLMARVEEAEKGDGVAARRWLARAAEAPGEDGWTCGACGARHARWQATCGHCGAFDRIAWSAGPRVDAPAAARAALASRASEGKGP